MLQDIKDAIAASRVSQFQETAAASVAGGLAKASQAGVSKEAPAESTVKSLKAFDVLTDTESSSDDEEDASD